MKKSKSGNPKWTGATGKTYSGVHIVSVNAKGPYLSNGEPNTCLSRVEVWFCCCAQVWAADAGVAHSPPSDLLWKSQSSWGSGDETVTFLVNSDGEVHNSMCITSYLFIFSFSSIQQINMYLGDFTFFPYLLPLCLGQCEDVSYWQCDKWSQYAFLIYCAFIYLP